MANRGGGWESVVGDLDEPEPDLEPTPTDLAPPAFLEPAAAPSREARPLLDLKSGERSSGSAPALPTPATRGVPLSLPKPTGGASSGPAAPAPGPRPPNLGQDFAGGLMERLGPAEDGPRPPKQPFFVQHKEVLPSLGIALLLGLGFVAYQTLGSDEAEVIATPANRTRTPGELDPPPPAPSKSVVAKAKAKVDQAPAEETSAGVETKSPEIEAPPPAPAQPLLSIMTVPPDATIEVNGFVRGKSPMVSKSPNGSAPIRIKITKNRYKTWEEVVSPNETGHFVVKVVLEER